MLAKRKCFSANRWLNLLAIPCWMQEIKWLTVNHAHGPLNPFLQDDKGG